MSWRASVFSDPNWFRLHAQKKPSGFHVLRHFMVLREDIKYWPGRHLTKRLPECFPTSGLLCISYPDQQPSWCHWTLSRTGFTDLKRTIEKSSYVPRQENIFPIKEVIADYENSLVSQLLRPGPIAGEGDPGSWVVAGQAQGSVLSSMVTEQQGLSRASKVGTWTGLHCQLALRPG